MLRRFAMLMRRITWLMLFAAAAGAAYWLYPTPMPLQLTRAPVLYVFTSGMTGELTATAVVDAKALMPDKLLAVEGPAEWIRAVRRPQGTPEGEIDFGSLLPLSTRAIERDGLRLRFTGLHAGLKPDSTVTLGLVFERAGRHELTVEARGLSEQDNERSGAQPTP